MKLIWKRGLAVSMALALLISALTVIPAAAETTRPDTIMGVAQLYDYDRALDRRGDDIGGPEYLMFTPASYSDNSRYGEYNYWTQANDYKIHQGLVEDTLDADGNVILGTVSVGNGWKKEEKQLTTPSAKSGKLFAPEEAVGTFQMPFRYNAATNRYEYDSKKNNLFANKDTGVLEYASALSDGYFPLGEGNYWFGMATTLPFIYKNGGKVNGEDMVFEFAGDDDVWVFVDGKLVLDLGGIHNAVTGKINFATGVVTTVGRISKGDKDNTEHYSSLFDTGFDTSAAEHTVKIFYLERGAGKANCKMSFNLLQPTNYIVKYYDGKSYDGKPGDNGMIAVSVQSARADGTNLYAGDTVTLDEIMIDINDATHALATSPDYYPGAVVDDNFQIIKGGDTVVTTVTEDDTDIVRVVFYPKPSYTVTYWEADNADDDKALWRQITQKSILGKAGQEIYTTDIDRNVVFDGKEYTNGVIVSPDVDGLLGTLSVGEIFNVNVLYHPDIEPVPTPTPEPTPTPVPSVLKNDYAYIFGRSDTMMEADDEMRRGEAAAVLHRLLKQNDDLNGFAYDINETPVFADLYGRWDRSAIEFMAYIGVYDADSEMVIGPDEGITRGEAFKMFALALGYTGDTGLTVEAYAQLLVDAGYVQGYEDGTLRLENIITRAEFCKIYNIIIGRDSSHYKLETADGTAVTPETYGFTDIEDGWTYEIMLKATSAFDENGYVDLEARGQRNNLDDFE